MVSNDRVVEAAKRDLLPTALPGPAWSLVGISQAGAEVQNVLGCNTASDSSLFTSSQLHG